MRRFAFDAVAVAVAGIWLTAGGVAHAQFTTSGSPSATSATTPTIPGSSAVGPSGSTATSSLPSSSLPSSSLPSSLPSNTTGSSGAIPARTGAHTLQLVLLALALMLVGAVVVKTTPRPGLHAKGYRRRLSL